MTTYKLITLDPLALYPKNIGGLPATLKRAGDPPVTPDGYAYVPVLDYPETAPAEGNVYRRALTNTEYGWAEVSGPAPAQPAWYEVPAWRIRAVAKVTPHGGGMLIDACTAAIAAIADAAEKATAEEVFFGGNTLRRDSALLSSLASGLGLTEADLDSLFQQAESIAV